MRPTAWLLVLTLGSCERSAPPAPSTASSSTTLSSAPPATPSAPPAIPPAATADASAPPNPWLPPTARPDLPATIAWALTDASSALGGKPFVHDVVGSFVLINADGGPRYAAALKLARRATPYFFDGRFEHAPERAIPVFVFSDPAAYTSFCSARTGSPCPSPFGEYDRSRREIVMHATPGAETLLHEMAHGVAAGEWSTIPRWFDEAIASVFENPVFCPDGKLTGASNWRYDDVKRALASPDDPSRGWLETLFSFDLFTFTTVDPAHPERGPAEPSKALRHEAVARYFAQWMDRRDLLFPFYRAWHQAFGSDRTGVRTFEQVTGQSLADASHGWERYVRSLAPPAQENACPR